MSDFEKMFEAFNISTELADKLKEVATVDFSLTKRTARVSVETILIKNGDRKVVKSEVLSAKLV